MTVSRFRAIPIIFSLLLLTLSIGCRHRDELTERRLVGLRDSTRTFFMLKNYDTGMIYARRLETLSDPDLYPSYYVASLVYQGQGYVYLIPPQPDSMKFYFDKVYDLAVEQEDYWALATMHNALGIDELYSNVGTKDAIYHFFEGLKYSELLQNDTLSTILNYNLTVAYYVRKDPDGLEYARAVYNKGVKSDNIYMIYSGALGMAHMYYILKDYDKALEYVRIAYKHDKEFKDDGEVNTLIGDILFSMGRRDDAKRYYDTALAEVTEDCRFTNLELFLSYGKWYMTEGDYSNALKLFEEGIENSTTNVNSINRYLLYQAAANACSLMNDSEKFCYYTSLYRHDVDSIFNYRVERDVADIKFSYARDKYEKEVKDIKGKSVIIKKRATIIVIAITLFLLTVGILVRIYYKKREKELLRMLSEKRERFISVRQIIKGDIETKSDAVTESETVTQTQTQTQEETDLSNNSRSSIADKKMEELFSALEKLMREEHIYREKNLTRDKVASLLSTNRTYLTNIINKYTDMSFLAYINTFRIEEAIKILSEKDNDIPMKAIVDDLGFGSISTFYRLFSAATGFSPSQFRASLSQKDKIA